MIPLTVLSCKSGLGQIFIFSVTNSYNEGKKFL